MLEGSPRPTHPGEILREDILRELSLSVTETARGLRVSRKQLSEVVNGRAAISPEMALRLEQGFGVDAAFWLDLQRKYDLWQVEHSGRVAGVHRFSTPSRMPGQPHPEIT